ncbi:phospholipase [Gemmobacter aquarius]|uniref:Phospholipase D n=1 Tax=Paragemmobacter aquarius TaxID=2169400 RepID=A0A2S0UMI8_9RHOB|nr:phospholipase D family protein [Gemmobacter aquarius]AWB49034.1 phospholipase [Gemmobacter aquarius]
MITTLAIWLVLLGLGIFAASVLALRSYTRFARKARGPRSQALPTDGPPTEPDRLLAPLLAAHPGQNGLANILDHKAAFAARAHAARIAGRSLDLIYYIWTTDTSGWLLLAELLDAADRGVRVRLLLDDVNVQGFDLAFLGLNQHPNVEVRLFNPVMNRGHWIRRGTEFALGLSRFNRRMHGKVWITDGRLAILGGRNIGDTYFGAPGSGARLSHDADMVLAGPLVQSVEQVFDTYWNLGLSLPILTLWKAFRISMARYRRRVARHANAPLSVHYKAEAMANHSAESLLVDPLRFTPDVTLLADPPEKAFGHRKEPWLLDRIETLLTGAKSEVLLTTPYFVPGASGLKILTDLATNGVKVKVLTNSLAATDLFAVHAAYRSYRQPLVASGAALYEYAPPRGTGRKRALLHSKIFVIDGEQALVGSHNFDLRSAYINIELGLLFREPVLVAELRDLFARQTRPENAFAVTARNGALYWNVIEDGRKGRETAEPEASLSRRLASSLIARLPHDWF